MRPAAAVNHKELSCCRRPVPGDGIALTPNGASRIRVRVWRKPLTPGFRQFGAIAAEVFGLIERLVRGGDEILMFNSYVGHQTRDADAQLRTTTLGVVRAGPGRQSLANPLCTRLGCAAPMQQNPSAQH